MHNEFNFNEVEISEELAKLGYIDIPLDKVKQFKKDLEIFISRDKMLFDFQNLTPIGSVNKNSNLMNPNSKPKPSLLIHPSSPDTSLNENKHLVMPTEKAKTLLANLSNDNKANYRANQAIDNMTRKMKPERLQVSDEYNDENSVSSAATERQFKRKVLRKKNGRTVIEESITDDASIYDGNMDYTSELINQPRLNRSSSCFEIDSETSDLEYNSVIRPIQKAANLGRVVKSDPVSRYHLYQQAWQAFKTPGEKAHKQLRWDIRAQMYYSNDLQIKKGGQQRKPNTYVVPTERKREKLIWKTRHDIANSQRPFSSFDF